MCCNKHVLADKTHHSCLDYNWHIILCHLCLIAIHWNTQLIPRQIGYGYIWFFQIVLIWCIQFFISGPFLYFYKNIISSHVLQTNRYDSGDNIESFFYLPLSRLHTATAPALSGEWWFALLYFSRISSSLFITHRTGN